MWRQHARFASGFRRSEHNDPEHRARRQRVDGRRLAVRGDHSLQVFPELVHRAQLGCLFGQPHQFDSQTRRQGLRRGGGVCTRAIEQQPDRAGAAVAPSHLDQERPRVGTGGALAREHDAMRGAKVVGAEQHPLRVLARDRDDGRRPHRGPRRAQRREQAEQRPIGDEDNIAGPNARSHATAESPFFCAR